MRGRAGNSPTMVGRASALAMLSALVESAEVPGGDQPSVALVAGEAGIGKTRLVEELLATLPADTPSYVVAAEPGSLGEPLAALGTYATADDPAAALLHDIADAIASGVALLVVEDIHWLDADTAAAVDAIARQPWPRLVIIGTYRPGDLSRGAPGGELVMRLERRHAVEQIRLDRLDRADVAAMLALILNAPPTSAVVDAVQRRSGGVPFVIEEIVKCCRGTDPLDDVLTAELPWSLEEAVRQQTRGLTADERRIVDALAVYGRSIGFDPLLTAAELDEDRATAALRGLLDRGVVIESADERFWFVHALVADAVSGQLMGRERRRLHERCLSIERGLPNADAATLARHAAGAGRFDEVVEIAREGAPSYLARGASFSALRLAAEALRESPDDVLLLAVASEAAWRLDFADEALATSNRWLAVATDPLDRIEAERLHGRVHQEQSDDAGRRHAIARLTAIVEAAADARERAHGEAAIAQLAMLAGESAEAVAWSDRAIADGVAAGDDAVVARAKVERASAMSHLASRADTMAALNDALAAARATGDRVLESRALNNSLEVVPLHSPAGRQLLASLIEVSRETGLDKMVANAAQYWQAFAAYQSGDLRGVRHALGGRAWPGARATGNRGHGDAVAAMLAWEEGRLDDADYWLGPQFDVAACAKETLLRIALQIAAERGDRHQAEVLLDRILHLRIPGDEVTALDDVISVTEAALAIGLDAAAVRAGVLERWIAGHPSFAVLAPPVEGLLAAADGRHPEAATWLAEALVAPDDRIGVPVLGSLRTTLAASLLAAGDRAGALAAVTQVLDGELAAWPGVRRDKAAALARRLHGSSARSDGELTAREREVSGLVAAGLTNGQLAERLFISPKTAAVHVSNILTKLGLSSRAEIAAWAVRNGIALATAS